MIEVGHLPQMVGQSAHHVWPVTFMIVIQTLVHTSKSTKSLYTICCGHTQG